MSIELAERNALSPEERQEELIKSLEYHLERGYYVELYHNQNGVLINKLVSDWLKDTSDEICVYSVFEDDVISINKKDIEYFAVEALDDPEKQREGYTDRVSTIKNAYRAYADIIDMMPQLLFRPVSYDIIIREYLPFARVFIMFNMVIGPTEDPSVVLKSSDKQHKALAINCYRRVLNERIKEFNQEIDEEIEELNNDTDLDADDIAEGTEELESVRDLVNNLEADIDLWSMETVFDILNYWPPLLLPAPDFIFENTVFKGT